MTESNDRTERKSCGDPYEIAAEERWLRQFDPEGDSNPDEQHAADIASYMERRNRAQRT